MHFSIFPKYEFSDLRGYVKSNFISCTVKETFLWRKKTYDVYLPLIHNTAWRYVVEGRLVPDDLDIELTDWLNANRESMIVL